MGSRALIPMASGRTCGSDARSHPLRIPPSAAGVRTDLLPHHSSYPKSAGPRARLPLRYSPLKQQETSMQTGRRGPSGE